MVGAPALWQWLADVPQAEQNRYPLDKSTQGAPGAQARCPTRRISLPLRVKLAVLQSLPISMRSIILLTEHRGGPRRTDEYLLVRRASAASSPALDQHPATRKLIDFSASRPI